MRRPSDPRQTLDKLQKLRRLNSYTTLRSTFIVGYPAERKEHYLHLRRFLREAAFDRAGFFIYSPEEGTSAYNIRPSLFRRPVDVHGIAATGAADGIAGGYICRYLCPADRKGD